MKKVCIVGASGGIGGALLTTLAERHDISHITAFSRSDYPVMSPKIKTYPLDITQEIAIQNAAESLQNDDPFDWLIISTGFLHNASFMPEKALKELTPEKFTKTFMVNTLGPALFLKHFLPLMRREHYKVVTLVGRVGSISDNQMGGWYSYRASKAALSMIIKNTALEMARKRGESIIVGLHPGTVNTKLSEPFQAHVPQGKLQSPQQAALNLIGLIDALKPQDSGKFFDYDGEEVAP